MSETLRNVANVEFQPGEVVPLRSRIQSLFVLVVAGLIAAASAPAWALDPTLAISSYGHRSWRGYEGLGSGPIGAMAQTSDGYLWLATPDGLQRFDGITSVPWPPEAHAGLAADGVRTLLGSRDGTLWIGTTKGLRTLINGRLTAYPGFEGRTINDIEEGADGAIWVGGSQDKKGLLCSIRGTKVACHDREGTFAEEITALHRDSTNALWVCDGNRVWNWTADPSKSYPIAPIALSKPRRAMTDIGPGTVVVGMGYLKGVAKVGQGKVEPLELPAAARDFVYIKAMRDRDGAVWLGTADSGLVRLHNNRVDTFSAADGLSGGQVIDLFEDREGNVWVATSRGLDQFRSVAVAPQANANGLTGRGRSLLATRDGSLWAGTSTGVFQLDPEGKQWSLRLPRMGGLFEDSRGTLWSPSPSSVGLLTFSNGRIGTASGVSPGPVEAVTEDTLGNVWIAHRSAGLMRMRPGERAHVVSDRYTFSLKRISTMIPDPSDGSLWLGLWSGEVENVSDGRIRAHFDLLGREPRSRVNQIRIEADGTVWASTQRGISRIKDGRAVELATGLGETCGDALWSLRDDRRVWILTRCGVAWSDSADLDSRASSAAAGGKPQANFRLLEPWDGVYRELGLAIIGHTTTPYIFAPKMARTPDGRIWAASGDDIVTIDPRRIPFNKLPPPVHIQGVVSDGHAIAPGSDIQIPPRPRNLRVDYTGLSFRALDRMQFRYRLDGWDTDWQEAGNRRQAFYTDLSPGNYRFHVIAANDSGVWNRAGDTLDFTIEPAWWQRADVRIAAMLAMALALFAFYRMRVNRLARMLEAETASRREIGRLYSDLQDRESRVRRLFNANIIGIFTWHLDGRILDANEAFARIVGYDIADLISGQRKWKDLMPPEWDPADDRIMSDMLATGVATPFEAEYIRKDGDRVPVLVGAALFDARPGEGVAFVLDLSERRKAERAARESDRRSHEMERRLADANRVASVGYLSAMIAHEVNQPLSGVITNASTVIRMLDAEPPVSGGIRDAVQRIIRDGNRAAEVIRRLRAMFSRKAPTLETIDLNEATREVVAMARKDLEKGGIDLHLELAEGLPAVQGDRIQLQQVILNLLRNASDAMSSVQDRPRHLLIRTGLGAPHGVCLAVRDAGIGLPAGELEKLFEAFHSEKGSGMGIGLFISRSIIERHQGRLWAESNEDHGLTLSFSLPLDLARTEPHDAAANIARAGESESNVDKGPPMSASGP